MENKERFPLSHRTAAASYFISLRNFVALGIGIRPRGVCGWGDVCGWSAERLWVGCGMFVVERQFEGKEEGAANFHSQRLGFAKS
jgi:hypothetical protein